MNRILTEIYINFSFFDFQTETHSHIRYERALNINMSPFCGENTVTHTGSVVLTTLNPVNFADSPTNKPSNSSIFLTEMSAGTYTVTFRLRPELSTENNTDSYAGPEFKR